MLCPVCKADMDEFDIDAYDEDAGFYYKCPHCGYEYHPIDREIKD